MLTMERAIYDFLASLVFDQLFQRFPGVRIASVENGSEFLADLFKKLRSWHRKIPGFFPEDPVELFRRNVWINPFWEDDVYEIAELMGDDRVIFGSDWPHIEGMPEPLDYAKELKDFDAGDPAADPARQRGRAEHAPAGLSRLVILDRFKLEGHGRDRHRRGPGHRRRLRGRDWPKRARTSRSRPGRRPTSKSVAEQIRALGRRAVVVPTDVTETDQLAALVDSTVNALGSGRRAGEQRGRLGSPTVCPRPAPGRSKPRSSSTCSPRSRSRSSASRTWWRSVAGAS